MNSLVKYDAACSAIAAAKSVDEVKDVRDKAEAMRSYARQAKNRNLEIDCAEIRMRAERRLGELIRAQKETVGLNVGKRGDRGPREAPRSDTRPTLASQGIDKKLSSRAQKLAEVPECPQRVRLSRMAHEMDSGFQPTPNCARRTRFLQCSPTKHDAAGAR